MRPSRHAVLATVALVLFWPTGIPALINAFSVDEAWFTGHPDEARRRSRRAAGWGWASVVAGLLSFAVTMVMMVAGILAVGQAVSSAVTSSVTSSAADPLAGLLGGALSGATGTAPGSDLGALLGGTVPGGADPQAQSQLADAMEQLNEQLGTSAAGPAAAMPQASGPTELLALSVAAQAVISVEQSTGSAPVDPVAAWAAAAGGQTAAGVPLTQLGVTSVTAAGSAFTLTVPVADTVCTVTVDPATSTRITDVSC